MFSTLAAERLTYLERKGGRLECIMFAYFKLSRKRVGSRHLTTGNCERATIVICFFYPSYTSAILFAVLLFFSPAFYRSFFSCRISVSSRRPSPRGGRRLSLLHPGKKKKHSPPSLTAREEEEERRGQKNAPVGNESVAGEKGEGLFLPPSCFSPRRHFLAPPSPLLSESGKNVAPAKAKKEGGGRGRRECSPSPSRPCA